MSDKQLAFINRLLEEKGVTLEEATKAAMGRRQSKLGKKGASKVIDWLMGQPSVKHVPRPASAKQLDFIASLARKAGVEPPKVETAEEASKAIDALKAKQPKRQARRSNGGGRRRPGGRCRAPGCSNPANQDAPHHPAMGGYCGSCAFDEFDC